MRCRKAPKAQKQLELYDAHLQLLVVDGYRSFSLSRTLLFKGIS